MVICIHINENVHDMYINDDAQIFYLFTNSKMKVSTFIKDIIFTHK